MGDIKALPYRCWLPNREYFQRDTEDIGKNIQLVIAPLQVLWGNFQIYALHEGKSTCGIVRWTQGLTGSAGKTTTFTYCI